jgi:hypothetical protein
MVVRKRSGWVEVEAKDKTSSLKDDNAAESNWFRCLQEK